MELSPEKKPISYYEPLIFLKNNMDIATSLLFLFKKKYFKRLVKGI